VSNYENRCEGKNDGYKYKSKMKMKFSYRQHRVFIARSKLWLTSQRHTVLESTAMSFIPCQYSLDYRHEHERRK